LEPLICKVWKRFVCVLKVLDGVLESDEEGFRNGPSEQR
jgi:hypothetical protein